MKPLYLQSLLLAAATAKNAIDEYVETPEPAFKWFDTGARVKTLGGTAHILNVTSLQWMTEAEAVGPLCGRTRWRSSCPMALCATRSPCPS